MGCARQTISRDGPCSQHAASGRGWSRWQIISRLRQPRRRQRHRVLLEARSRAGCSLCEARCPTRNKSGRRKETERKTDRSERDRERETSQRNAVGRSKPDSKAMDSPRHRHSQRMEFPGLRAFRPVPRQMPRPPPRPQGRVVRLAQLPPRHPPLQTLTGLEEVFPCETLCPCGEKTSKCSRVPPFRAGFAGSGAFDFEVVESPRKRFGKDWYRGKCQGVPHGTRTREPALAAKRRHFIRPRVGVG